MVNEYLYSFDIDLKYCYPNSSVLKNKLNITNEYDLSVAERKIGGSLRMLEIENEPLKGKLDFKHLKDIHYYIFKDIYDWAGQIRTVNISKGNVFCYCENIESYAGDIFYKLKEENYLINTDKDAIYDRFSFYMSEINALHPFREGNGRSQRVFMSYLAKVAGYELNFEEITQKKMIELSSLAFNNGHEEYINMFKKIVRPISNQEQMDFIESIGLKSILIKNIKIEKYKER
ncbi:MAG: Fic family protein [Sedimentibacter sp.]|uniref:Fic/DOC family protein n=1 Tax=Sedimentibacter sp. TaxID=1960295 RepID=UPI002980B0E4|nr:Fic family protein [Sedimentibacter sp.]MDW5299213.1 Fic family protein [Sedimentibacter sp.]